MRNYFFSTAVILQVKIPLTTTSCRQSLLFHIHHDQPSATYDNIMRSSVPFFAALFMAFQLVMAVPAVLPMVYGGLVSNQLRTDREYTCPSLHWIDLANNLTVEFNRIRLAPGYVSPARRSGRISSPDAPSANGKNVTIGNSTTSFNNGEAHGQNGGNSTSADITGRSSSTKLH